MTVQTRVAPKTRNGRERSRARTSRQVDDLTIERLCSVFKMLADPSRMKILLALGQDRTMHVSALCKMLGQSQPAVSHHLTLMRMAGLVRYERQGKHNFYRLDSSQMGEILAQFFAHSGNREQQFQFDDFSLLFETH